MKTPSACALFLILVLAPGVFAQGPLLASARSEMSELPDSAPAWERIGEGHAFLLEDGTLAVNDNSNGERIAFQTLIGGLTAAHELRARARVRVISNVGGGGATFELARPGLELIVRMYPDRLVVGERDAQGDFHWLGHANLDLSELVELEIRKLPAISSSVEQVTIMVDGAEILRVQPRALGGLGIGRVLFGSLSNHDMGATIWDWIEWEQREAGARLPAEACSIGELKSRFAN